MNKSFLPILTLAAALMLLPCSLSCNKPAPDQGQEQDKDKDKDKDFFLSLRERPP